MQQSPVPRVHLSISVAALEIDPAVSGNINSDHPSVLFPLLFIFSLLGVSISINDSSKIGKDPSPILLGVLRVCFLVYLINVLPKCPKQNSGLLLNEHDHSQG